jgi:D-alanyl-D-alanine dipeptidase
MRNVFVVCVFLHVGALYPSEPLVNIHASIKQVPIQENGEPLVDLREQNVIAYKASYLLENPDCTKVRRAVYEKLCLAQQRLPSGLRFEFNIGLRSLEVQKKIFDEVYEKLQKEHPTLSHKELFDETSKLVAPVKNWNGDINVPPHSTGGAIDIVLIDSQGNPVDMGEDPNDPFNQEIIRTDSTSISLEARKARDTMGRALSSVGFVNYPGEFWHWSYGDRRWAFETQAKCSIYGPISSPH